MTTKPVPHRRSGSSTHRTLVPLLLAVATLLVTEHPAWAQSCSCVDEAPEGCVPDCDFDDIAPFALPGCLGCVEAEDIPYPPSPRCPSDRYFVKELSAYSCDGWGDPIDKTIKVTRYVGPTAAAPQTRLIDWEDYVAKGRISATATLSIMAWDVDTVGSSCFPKRERDDVKFNGVPVNEMGVANGRGQLRGSNQRWGLTQFKIPIEYVNFPSTFGTGGGAPPSAANVVTIDVPDPCRCVVIGWVSLRFKVASPVVLVLGGEQKKSFWENAQVTIDDELKAERFVVIKDVEHQAGSFSEAAVSLAKLLKLRAAEYGVDSLHLVTHSKGGPDSVRLLAKEYSSTGPFKVISLTTISAPLRGTVLLDMVVARQQALVAFFFGFPPWTDALVNFFGAFIPDAETGTTWKMATFMNDMVPLLPRRGIKYQTVSADLDINDSKHVSCSPDETFSLRNSVPILDLIPCSWAQPLLDSIYRSVRLKRTVQYKVFFGLWVEVTAVPASSQQGNDVFVSIKSSLGPAAYRSLVVSEIIYNFPTGGKDHVSITDDEVGGDIIPLIESAEISDGDFRKFRYCVP